MSLGLIVEGHGEVSALPVLVRSVATEILTVPSPEMTHPAFDLTVARDTCPSFDKLVRALGALLSP